MGRKKAEPTVEEQRAETQEGDAFVARLLKNAGDLKPPRLIFAIISARRANNVSKMETFLVAGGASLEDVVWVVASGELATYKAAGANGEVIEGGALCSSRNAALDVARDRGYDYCVQLSDDLVKAQLLRIEPATLANYGISERGAWEPLKPNFVMKAKKELRKGERTANEVANELKLRISVVSAARLAAGLIVRRSDAKLAGGSSNRNLGFALGTLPVQSEQFIVGDFIVVDAKSAVRFDERFTLKEDYDFTCQHLCEYGAVLRVNKLVLEFQHYTNSGGAVDVRTKHGKGEKDFTENPVEQRNIAWLLHKWPGVFRTNTQRGPNEILLRWAGRSTELGGERELKRPLPPFDGNDNENKQPASRARKKGKSHKPITFYFTRSAAAPTP